MKSKLIAASPLNFHRKQQKKKKKPYGTQGKSKQTSLIFCLLVLIDLTTVNNYKLNPQIRRHVFSDYPLALIL